jgi:hypothetical protein
VDNGATGVVLFGMCFLDVIKLSVLPQLNVLRKKVQRNELSISGRIIKHVCICFSAVAILIGTPNDIIHSFSEGSREDLAEAQVRTMHCLFRQALTRVARAVPRGR